MPNSQWILANGFVLFISVVFFSFFCVARYQRTRRFEVWEFTQEMHQNIRQSRLEIETRDYCVCIYIRSIHLYRKCGKPLAQNVFFSCVCIAANINRNNTVANRNSSG